MVSITVPVSPAPHVGLVVCSVRRGTGQNTASKNYSVARLPAPEMPGGSLGELLRAPILET